MKVKSKFNVENATNKAALDLIREAKPEAIAEWVLAIENGLSDHQIIMNICNAGSTAWAMKLTKKALIHLRSLMK